MQLGGGNGEETEPETDETEITETLRYSNNSGEVFFWVKTRNSKSNKTNTSKIKSNVSIIYI